MMMRRVHLQALRLYGRLLLWRLWCAVGDGIEDGRERASRGLWGRRRYHGLGLLLFMDQHCFVALLIGLRLKLACDRE